MASSKAKTHPGGNGSAKAEAADELIQLLSEAEWNRLKSRYWERVSYIGNVDGVNVSDPTMRVPFLIWIEGQVERERAAKTQAELKKKITEAEDKWFHLIRAVLEIAKMWKSMRGGRPTTELKTLARAVNSILDADPSLTVTNVCKQVGLKRSQYYDQVRKKPKRKRRKPSAK